MPSSRRPSAPRSFRIACVCVLLASCGAGESPDASSHGDVVTVRDGTRPDGDAPPLDVPSADATFPDAASRPDAAHTDALSPDVVRLDVARPDVVHVDAARPDVPAIACPRTFAPAYRYAMTQPSITDLDPYLVVNPGTAGHPSPRPDSFYIQVVDMGSNPMGHAIGWAVGDFTGFRPPAPVSTWQRGIAPDWYGSTAVQAHGAQIGLQIQTASIRSRGTIARPLQTITIDRNFTAADDVRPWRGPGDRLGMGVSLRVPRYQTNGQGVVYVNLFALLLDTSTNTGLWYGAGLFDSRTSLAHGDMVLMDDTTGSGTGLLIIQSDLMPTASLVNPINSASTRAAIPDLREFRFEISRDDFTRGLARAASQYGSRFRASRDPSDYRLTLITLNPEVALITNSAANDSWMGVEVQGLRAYLGPECFDEHAYLAAYPDVAAAVASHMYSSGLSHYQQHGRFEGRNGCGVPACVFDEALYLACNPDVATAVTRGQYASAWQHYELHGLDEHRIACSN